MWIPGALIELAFIGDCRGGGDLDDLAEFYVWVEWGTSKINLRRGAASIVTEFSIFLRLFSVDSFLKITHLFW
jgi:hypothetical protein